MLKIKLKYKIFISSKKELLDDEVAIEASLIAKNLKNKKNDKKFSIKLCRQPSKKFSGSVLDGRDITSVIMKDAK